jgi:hypothetical protein
MLEKQLIGTFQHIKSESQLVVSSDFTLADDTVRDSPNEKVILDAIRNRPFNLEKINAFKQLELVGEQNRGFLEIINHTTIRKDQELYQSVTFAVEKENSYRKIILSRLSSMNESSDEKAKNKMERLLANINKNHSLPGTWIQLEDGSWVKKE